MATGAGDTNGKAGKLTGLRTPSVGYKPFRYPWAYEFWRRQQQVHWMPEEVPARRGREGLGLQAQRSGTQSADADLPLLHPVRCRGERQLHGALRARVQTDRDQDDARVVLEHRDHPHRRLRPAARNHRHARKRIRGVLRLPGDARQARLHGQVRRRDRRRYPAHRRDVRRLHRRPAAVRVVRDADELPALQQDEGHGPDRDLVACATRACTAKA